MRYQRNSFILMILAMVISIIGIIAVYLSSNVWAVSKYNDAFYYLKRQSIFALLGFIAMFVFSKIKIQFWKKNNLKILLFSLFLLILVIIPGVGLTRGGSTSWLGYGSIVFQPSEIYKMAIIIYASYYLSKYYDKSHKFIKYIIPIILISMIGFFLIMLQPDFGTGVVMLLAIVCMCLVSKSSFKNYLLIASLGVVGVIRIILSAPYRLERIYAYIDPWSDPLGSGFQIIQSLYAIGPGGLFGLGINNSIQKHYFLPEPQTDFIFAIFAEEFGFIGGVVLIGLFGLLIYYGYKIALNAKDNFSSFLCVGITSLIAIQIVINLGVVVGLFPVTGITLPFISYGGSSLVILLSGIGIMARVGEESACFD